MSELCGGPSVRMSWIWRRRSACCRLPVWFDYSGVVPARAGRYVDPEVCLQRHEASQGTLATILQHLNFARLASNLGHADSTQG